MTPKGNAITWAIVGCGIIGYGVVAYSLFSPSPHGYGELFIAFPAIILGLGIATGALALGPFRRVIRIPAWIILAILVLPILLAIVVLSLWLFVTGY